MSSPSTTSGSESSKVERKMKVKSKDCELTKVRDNCKQH
jgi:hypothetical protein